MKFNKCELQILAIILAVWGTFMTGSGIIMAQNKKIITRTHYKLDISTQQLSKTQARKNEIVLKEIEVEIDNPISVNVEDYLVDPENMNENILKQLKLDTSLVNVSQAGTYNYTITYKKKKYQSTVTVKKKELPDMSFTLKNITLYLNDAIPVDKRAYINENISDEVYQNIVLDLSQVDNTKQNDYKYYLIYKNTRYEGTISVRARVILPSTSVHSCPSDIAEYDSDLQACKCKDSSKKYDSNNRKCTD